MNHVEFVSYDGRWPNLCRGNLVLLIDGERAEFHYGYYKDEDAENGRYKDFWVSGGSCGFSADWVESYVDEGRWEVWEGELPEKFRKYAEEIEEVINENMPWGCCGGCL